MQIFWKNPRLGFGQCYWSRTVSVMKWFVGILRRNRIRSIFLIFILFVSCWIILSRWNSAEFDIELYLNANWGNSVRIEKVNFSRNPNHVCSVVEGARTIITVVHSARQNFQSRLSLRETMGSFKSYKGWHTPLVFIVGVDTTSKDGKELDQLLEKESAQYNDLIYGDFEDTYNNLSYKHIAALQWANEFCPDAAFYLKTDDDYLIEMFQVVNLVSTINTTDFNYYCKCRKGWLPFRVSEEKYSVTYEEFPGYVYPDLCNGMYIVRMETTKKILSMSQRVKYFSLEDVFVSGILREAWNYEQKKKLLGLVEEERPTNLGLIGFAQKEFLSHFHTRRSWIDLELSKQRLMEIHMGRSPERAQELWKRILKVYDDWAEEYV